MTKNDAKSMLDQDFLKAYANCSRAMQSTTMPSTAPQMNIAGNVTLVRVSLSNTSHSMRASFDPVSVEEDLRTKSLNQTARMGYKSAKVSTR